MDLGTTLRTARERRNLSLDRLASATKIGKPLLQAIEDNDFGRLPGGIFARGFVRAYAREVGLDPEEIVEQFIAETGGTPAAGQAPGAGGGQEAGRVARSDVDIPRGGPTWAYVSIVAVLLAVFVLYTRGTERETMAPDAGVPAMHDQGAEPAAEATSGESVDRGALVEAPTRAVAADGSLLRLQIATQGPCWVEVVADGRIAVYRLMQAGERETVDVRSDVSIRVGDPAAFAFSINGRPGRPLGRPGVPATVRLTPANYHEFLDAPAR